MSSLISNDRVSVCLFTFSDGRRCRTPRSIRHPHFCFYHARKESQARAAENLGEDLSNFFSRDFVNACDLSSALARLLPAVARGDIKPKTATTLAYMAQTFLQTLHLPQNEFIAAIGELEWRKTVCNSLNQNFKYLNSKPDDYTEFPAHPPTPPPSPAPPAPPARPTPAASAASPVPSASAEACHPERSDLGFRPGRKGSCLDSAPSTTDETPTDSIPSPSTEPAANPGTQPSQPDAKAQESARANATLATARSRFRRRSSNTPSNSFKTSFYTTPRK